MSTLSPHLKTKQENKALQRRKLILQEESVPAVQMQADKNAATTAPTNIETQLQNPGGGTSLDANVQQEMGNKIGADFSNVKVHTDSNAVQMNKELGAKAFTYGNNIYFNEGNYNPTSHEGKHLLAHELTHTMQQDRGALIQRVPEDVTDELELGRKLLSEFPDGVNMIFYEIDDPEAFNHFQGSSRDWASYNDAIGLNKDISSPDIKVEDIGIGYANKEYYVVSGTGSSAETLGVDDIIIKISTVLKAAVEKAAAEDNIPVNHNAYKIKMLALGSHGSVGYASCGVYDDNYETFISTISPYLTNNVNMIFYACTVSRDPDEKDDDWMGTYNEPGGEESLTGKVRDKLADLGHADAETWGHTAVGDFLSNYTLRVFTAGKKGEPGESFSIKVFQPYIDELIAITIEHLQSNDYLVVTEEEVAAIAQNVYEKAKENFRRAYSSAFKSVTYEMDVEGEKEKVTFPELAPTDPQRVIEDIREFYETEWEGTKPDAKTVSEKVLKIMKKELKQVIGISTLSPELIIFKMKSYLDQLDEDQKELIPSVVQAFEGIQVNEFSETFDESFFTLVESFQTAINTIEEKQAVNVGEIDEVFIKKLTGENSIAEATSLKKVDNVKDWLTLLEALFHFKEESKTKGVYSEELTTKIELLVEQYPGFSLSISSGQEDDQMKIKAEYNHLKEDILIYLIPETPATEIKIEGNRAEISYLTTDSKAGDSLTTDNPFDYRYTVQGSKTLVKTGADVDLESYWKIVQIIPSQYGGTTDLNNLILLPSAAQVTYNDTIATIDAVLAAGKAVHYQANIEYYTSDAFDGLVKSLHITAGVHRYDRSGNEAKWTIEPEIDATISVSEDQLKLGSETLDISTEKEVINRLYLLGFKEADTFISLIKQALYNKKDIFQDKRLEKPQKLYGKIEKLNKNLTEPITDDNLEFNINLLKDAVANNLI